MLSDKKGLSSMSGKKISIGTWAYIWAGYAEDPIPLATALDQMQTIGADGVEFTAFPPHLPLEEYGNQAKRKEIKKMIDDHDLGVSGLVIDFTSVPPTTTNPDDYIEVVKAGLDVAHDIGSPSVRVDTVSPPTEIPGGMDYESCFGRVAQVFNRAAEECAKAGVLLVWEPEPGFLFNKPSEWVRLTYAVDHPNFKILFDFCHAHMCAVVGSRQLGEEETLPGGVAQLAHMLTGKIGHIHFIDSDETLHDDDTSTHAPLGTGVLDFDPLLDAVEDAGYDGDWWALDLCFWPHAMDVIPANLKYLQDLRDRRS